MNRTVRHVFWLSMLVLACAAQASAASPKLGTYRGQTTNNAKGNATLGVTRIRALDFELTIAHGQCPPAGGAKKQAADCVTVSPNNAIQATCAVTGLISDAFFPATGPIALPASGTVTHRFTLYGVGGSASVAKPAGAVKVGTFQLTLSVDGAGGVTGSARYAANLNDGNGVCDSGVIKIAAKLR